MSYTSEYHADMRREDPARAMLRDAKYRAKKKGIPFELSYDDILVPNRCPVLGIPLIPGSSSDNSPNLDRIIPALGYVPGNVVVVSRRANRIKNDSTAAELKKLAAYYAKTIRVVERSRSCRRTTSGA